MIGTIPRNTAPITWLSSLQLARKMLWWVFKLNLYRVKHVLVVKNAIVRNIFVVIIQLAYYFWLQIIFILLLADDDDGDLEKLWSRPSRLISPGSHFLTIHFLVDTLTLSKCVTFTLSHHSILSHSVSVCHFLTKQQCSVTQGHTFFPYTF